MLYHNQLVLLLGSALVLLGSFEGAESRIVASLGFYLDFGVPSGCQTSCADFISLRDSSLCATFRDQGPGIASFDCMCTRGFPSAQDECARCVFVVSPNGLTIDGSAVTPAAHASDRAEDCTNWGASVAATSVAAVTSDLDQPVLKTSTSSPLAAATSTVAATTQPAFSPAVSVPRTISSPRTTSSPSTPTPGLSNSTGESPKKSTSIGPIVGGFAAGVVLLLAAGLAFFLRKRRARSSGSGREDEEESEKADEAFDPKTEPDSFAVIEPFTHTAPATTASPIAGSESNFDASRHDGYFLAPLHSLNSPSFNSNSTRQQVPASTSSSTSKASEYRPTFAARPNATAQPMGGGATSTALAGAGIERIRDVIYHEDGGAVEEVPPSYGGGRGGDRA